MHSTSSYEHVQLIDGFTLCITLFHAHACTQACFPDLVSWVNWSILMTLSCLSTKVVVLKILPGTIFVLFEYYFTAYLYCFYIKVLNETEVYAIPWKLLSWGYSIMYIVNFLQFILVLFWTSYGMSLTPTPPKWIQNKFQ